MFSAESATSAETVPNNTKRYFISSEPTTCSEYLLPADNEERERLNLQSETINAIFDNKAVVAPVALQDGDIVLDSGTGSGHWLLTLAGQVSSAVILRGVDISPRMFPPPSLIPSNATFQTLSITSLPADWTNSLSLIHQRLFMFALNPGQWKDTLSEMYRTLTPGGWVQLFEPSYLFDTAPDTVNKINKHKAVLLRDELCRVRGVVYDIVDYLSDWLEEAGFINVKIEKRGLPMGSWAGDFGTKALHSTMAIFPSIKEQVMKENGLGYVRDGEEYDVVVADWIKTLDETPQSFFQYWAFVAQKPVNA